MIKAQMRLYVKLQQMGEDQFFLQQVYCKYTADVPQECLYVDPLNNVFMKSFVSAFISYFIFSSVALQSRRPDFRLIRAAFPPRRRASA